MKTNFTILIESDFHKLDSKSIGKILNSETAAIVKECTDELESKYRYSDVVFTQVSKTHRMITSSVSNKGEFKTVAANIDEVNDIYLMSVLEGEIRSDFRFKNMASLVGNLNSEDAKIITLLNKAL